MIKMFEHIQDKIREGFKSSERMPREKAEKLANDVTMALGAAGIPKEELFFGGSMRRGSPTIGDIDVVVFNTTANTDTWMRAIAELQKAGHEIKDEYTDPKGKVRKMPMGDAQASRLVDGENVDFKTWDPKLKGAMMIHATGNTDFNVGMRSWLKRFGWGFSQAGLKNDKGEVVAAETEEEIFKAMGMEFVPPEKRNGFIPPKNPPGGAAVKAPVQAEPVKPEAPKQGPGTQPPQDILAKVPEDVKAKLKTFVLPATDEKGNQIPRDFLWNKKSRHQYYKGRGVFKVADDLKLDRYLGGPDAGSVK